MPSWSWLLVVSEKRSFLFGFGRASVDFGPFYLFWYHRKYEPVLNVFFGEQYVTEAHRKQSWSCEELMASVGYAWESKIIRFKAGVRSLSLGVSIFVYCPLSSAPPPLFTLQTEVQHCSFQPGNVKGACSQKWTDKCKTTAELFFLLRAILVCYFDVEVWKEER